MTELYATGRIVDLILALVAVELVLLAAIHRRTGRGVAPGALLPTLLSGALLLLALRCALAGAEWPWIGACLLGALLAHGADLRQRWRG